MCQVLICRPSVKSEWRHALPISAKNKGLREPLSWTQLLHKNQLFYIRRQHWMGYLGFFKVQNFKKKLNWKNVINICYSAWRGGGEPFNAPSRFSVLTRKRIEISAWNLANLLLYQFYPTLKKFSSAEKKNELWSILWRHYNRFLAPKQRIFLSLSKTHFRTKMQMKTPKDINRRALQDGYLGFSKF